LLIFFGLSSCIATKGLISSVKEIAELIEREEINDQNKRIIKEKVQRIVSRDVSSSSLEHLLRSSTESLTENSVDGIFGPLFWIFIGIVFMKFSVFLPGPLSLGFSYKAISTLDSMIGYKYDYFKYLGFFSAKIEDIFTFVPSRLVLITLPLVSSKVNEYGSIIKKSYLDGKKYDSPNAGISEAIFAYIAGIKLGGKSKYKKEIHAVMCFAFTNKVPINVEELDKFSQDAHLQSTHRGQNVGQIAIAYTVWSKKKGGGKLIVKEVYKKIKKSNHLNRLVTLSPLTEMATKFHSKNGAKLLQVNETTQNFEYEIIKE